MNYRYVTKHPQGYQVRVPIKTHYDDRDDDVEYEYLGKFFLAMMLLIMQSNGVMMFYLRWV